MDMVFFGMQILQSGSNFSNVTDPLTKYETRHSTTDMENVAAVLKSDTGLHFIFVNVRFVTSMRICLVFLLDFRHLVKMELLAEDVGQRSDRYFICKLKQSLL